MLIRFNKRNLVINNNKSLVKEFIKDGIDSTILKKQWCKWGYKKTKDEKFLEVNINLGYLVINYQKRL